MSVHRVRQLLKIRHPIIAAPMAGASGARLATEVTRAGGLGFISAGYGEREVLGRELKLWQQLSRDQHRASGSGIPLGVGFVSWVFDKHPDLFPFVMAHHTPATPIGAVMFSFGTEHGIRDRIKQVLKPQSIPVLYQAQTVEQVMRCVQTSAGVDAWVAQGNESGGHGMNNQSTAQLVPAIIHAAGAHAPVISAGGIMTGRDVAAQIVAGAGGVSLGTRFCLTPECLIPESMKQRMLKSKGSDTIRSTVMDTIRFPFPDGYDGRSLIEPVIARWHANGKEDELKANSALLESERKRMAGETEGSRFVWCGTGVERARSIAPAAELVAQIVAEANSALTSAANEKL